MAEGGEPARDLQTQKKQISDFFNKPLIKGETWYLIDSKWFKQWKKYVGYDSWDAYTKGNSSFNPGRIDNSALIKDGTDNHLKEHLIVDLDYVLMPKECWDKLAEWYGSLGGQEPIARQVVEYGMYVKHCKVEVYLMELKLCENGKADKSLTHQFSKADTIETIENTMRKLFNISDETETRVWNKYMSNTYEHLSKKENTVQDAGLYQGQVLVIEKKNEDGSWPRQSSVPSASSSSSSPPTSTDNSRITGLKDSKHTNSSTDSRIGKKLSMSNPTPLPPFTDDDLIRCSICHIEIEDPRSLLCLHTYCLRCLREWSKGKTDEVVCPLCREPTPLPPNGVDGLRKNFFVTKLKERKTLARQLVDKDVKTVCTSCETTDGNATAVARCSECEDFLCSSCVKIHKSLRVLRDHKVLTLDELKSGNAKLSDDPKKECCSEHESQVLWFYCNTCSQPICRDCTVVDHPATSHELVKLRDAIAGQKEEIETLAKSCKYLQTSIKTSLQSVETSLEALDQSCSEASAAVKNAKDDTVTMMTKQIQQIYQDHLNKISMLKSEKGKNLMERKEKLQMLDCRLNSALMMANEVVEGGSDSDIASVYYQLTSTFKQLQQAPTLPRIPMSVSTCKFRRIDLKFGELLFGCVHDNTFSTDNWHLIREFGNTGEGKLKKAKGLTITGQGRVAVADYGASKVYIYNYRDGRCIQAIDTKQSLFSNPSDYKSYPFTVAVFDNGNYLVGDCTKYPTVYDCTGSYVRQIKPVYNGRVGDTRTYSIAVDKHGNVFMGSVENGKLDILNESGSTHSLLDVSFNLRYIAISTDDHIIISADSSKGANVINSKSQVIHTLRPPTDVTPSWCPAGVCTIGEGDEEEIFICNRDGKKGVYRFLLKTGKYLGCLTANLQCPQSVAFAVEDELLLITEESSVKVFAPIQ